MKFVTIRLGKDSVSDIKAINGLKGGVQKKPLSIDVTCTQIPSDLSAKTIAFIWLGSDNAKGAVTDWKQGFKAVGEITKVKKGAKYKDEATTSLKIVYVFSNSINRVDILEKAPLAYYCCSALPIIGIDDHSNQTIRSMVSEGDRSDIGAFLFALNSAERCFHSEIIAILPELKDAFSFINPKTNEKFFIEKDSLFSYNRIIFGAPGTGKSFLLNKDAKKVFCKKEPNEIENVIIGEISDILKISKSESSSYELFKLGFKYATFFNNIKNKDKLTNEQIAKRIGYVKENGDPNTGGISYVIWGAQIAEENGIIKNLSLEDKYVERVTFHSNYSYAQFVGTYKPVARKNDLLKSLSADKKYILDILKDKSKNGQEKYDLLYEKFRDDNSLTRLPLLIGLYSDDEFQTKKMDGSAASGDNSVERNHGRAIRSFVSLYDDKSTNDEITYEYVPGPFMRTYVAAKKDPNQKYLLIIEEINRANVAAVFGDAFQLLDRDKNGVSIYPVAASEDVKKYLIKNDIEENELRIPSNMYIWATMNSADQGVFPMDTAFKRRWEFEYIGIDDRQSELVYEDDGSSILVPVPSKSGAKNEGDLSYDLVKWNNLRMAINAKLSGIPSVNEDKLLGPFFISREKLLNAKNKVSDFIRTFKSKVLMYLYEDVVKISPTKLFEKCGEHPKYSDICSNFKDLGVEIFGYTLDDIAKFDEQK